MLLLGLDTATPAVTVALHDGNHPLAQLVTVDAHRHAELLAPAVAKVVADAGASQRDLTAIVAGVGPGPFTGLRVGLVTARVLGAALNIPVYGLCSLDAIAADVVSSDDPPDGDFLVATDARRRELYWARYDNTGRRSAGPEVSSPADIPDRGLPAAGEGPMLYPGVLPDSLGPAYPAAATLCRVTAAALAAGDPNGLLLPPEPLYLRRPDVREPGKPKRVTDFAPDGKKRHHIGREIRPIPRGDDPPYPGGLRARSQKPRSYRARNPLIPRGDDPPYPPM